MKLLHTFFKDYVMYGCLLLFLVGHSASLTAQDCITSPVITCPPIFYGCTGDDLSPDALGYATAVAGDANCPAPVVTYRDVTTSTDLCGTGTIIKRFWKAEYPNNTNPWLFAECTQVLVLTDSENPVITNCPPDVVVGTDSDCRAIVSWDQPSATDDCGLLGFTSNFGSGSAFYPGVTTVTYTATDNCGNMTTCSFTVTVQEACCNDTPSLVVPSDYEGCLASSTDPSVTGQATGTISGFGCGDPTITFSDEVTNDADCSTLIRRTWTAVNPNNTNASSSGVQWIRLTDNNSPVIMNCPSDFSVVTNSNCMATVSWPMPTASDNCGLFSFTSNITPGTSLAPGVTTVTYTATDNCGNTSTCSFRVTVISDCCDGVPLLQLPPNYSGCPDSSTEPTNTGIAVATIQGSGCVAPMITHSDELISDSDCGLTIRRTWVATNPNFPSQSASGMQLIVLEDNVAPVISGCPTDITVNSGADCIAVVNFAMPTASDNCGIFSFVSDRPTGSGSRFEIGTTTITYTALDDCGNVATCSFDVTVLPNCCSDDMIVNCPPDYNGCPGTSTDPSVTGMATSNASSDCPADVTYFDQMTSDFDCSGSRVIERHWVAMRTDGSDSDTCVQRISLIDTQAPVITDCVANVTLAYEDRTYTWPDPIISDDCTTTIQYSMPKGTTFSVGTTQVTATVRDNCGNTTTCQFSVTVLQQNTGAGLVVTCPGDMNITCGASNNGRVPRPTATSDCELCQSGSIPGFVYMGERDGKRYYCSKDKMTWPDAQQFCESSGGHLAIINDAGENSFLSGILQANSAYIGLSDHASEGDFRWVDGSPLTYTRWYPRQPNNYYNRQDYVELLRNGYWNDQYNDKPLEFIMEIECLSITQTAGPAYLSDINQNTTVSFQIVDACGNTETCSYQIAVSNDVSLSCPSDIEVSTDDDQVVVYFETPEFETCCTDCGHPDDIPGFVYMGARGGSFYYCSKDKDTWHNANATARQIGGHLAIIGSAGENAYLRDLINNRIAFIGISDHAEEGVWRNVNGGKQSYFNWRFDNPNNYEGIQHYVELEPSGKWNDNTATYKREYIVEIEGCGRVRQTSSIPSGGYFPKGTTKVGFEAKDACGNERTCFFDVQIEQTVNNVQVEYCDSYGNNSSRAYINKVQINDMTNVSGNNGGYLNYSDQCANLVAGQSFKLSVTPGWGPYRYYAYYKMWVDYNRDGDFTDHGEYIGKSRSANTISGTLTVPTGARSGETTMRIAMSLTGYPESCGANYYGETEDYCVNIAGLTSEPSDVKGNRPKAQIEETFFTDLEYETIGAEASIYPSPADDYFNIKASDIIKKLTIIGVDGRVVKAIKDPSSTINVSDISPGLYLVRMIDDAGLEISEKIVIQ